MVPEKDEKTTENWLKEAQKGYTRMGVLILINKKPSHGYEIMKEIDKRTKGFWQPTPGGVYPVLSDLEKSGYIKGEWQTQKNRKLKVYTITPSGELVIRRAIIKQAEIFSNISNLFREFSRDVLNTPTPYESIPSMPSPLTPFLEDKVDSKEDLKHLEFARQRTYEQIKSMRVKLKELDDRIREIKKKEKVQAAPESK